ncbi:unnamed protein product [Rotaria socialis]|uniref:Uncharacterized protein n=1 Tax=Rotaria socialis TaxID=392032 RepID=A0A818U1W0_9BILA|nr:unnamed protein product [Rotaria socialis]
MTGGLFEILKKQIGSLGARTCHKWSEIFISGDLDEFLEDGRGGKREPGFFDVFPELENMAKLYALEGCQRKAASFTSLELAQYVDKQYYDFTGEAKVTNDLIRSEKACRLDLRRWGCRFEKNTAKPYWAGDERSDVVEARKQFVQYFLTKKGSYYLISEGDNPDWIIPQNNPTILLFHDESCFRSGETTAKRWFFSEQTMPFFSKGRGRSLMLSDFLVSHPENPFFELSQSEWAAATAKYSELLEENNIEYIDRSASASIQVDNGAYFDNDAVLSQFTRLFKMLPFKQAHKNKVIIIIVDNARTHSAKEFSLEDFGMKPGTRCPIDQILYNAEMGQHQKLDCCFTSGRHKGKSKGLLILAEELKILVPPKTSLDHLKQLLSSHNAFQNLRLFFVFYFHIFDFTVFENISEIKA